MIAFCFPGQGSLEEGDGPRHRPCRARGDGRVRARQRGIRPRPEAALFDSPLDDLVQTEIQQPALVATTSRCWRRCVPAGSSRTSSSATPSASSPLWRLRAPVSVEEAIALVRERGLAMAEAARVRPGSMAAILGLDDPVVEELCRRIEQVWPANHNCPGRWSSRARTRPWASCAAAEEAGARRAVKLRVSGAFHSPLVARAARRFKPAVERVPLLRPRGAVRLDGHGEDRARPALRRSSTSDGSVKFRTEGDARNRPAGRRRSSRWGRATSSPV